MIPMKEFEDQFSEKIKEVLGSIDPAHDLEHVKRVVAIAKRLAFEEEALLEVVIPAAWLHDLVNLPKDHPERKRASELAAFEALIFLKKIRYPEIYQNGIHHAIVAHSFSAGIKPESIEAKIVQDADRLDALGAVGLARLFAISSQLGRPFYSAHDPFAKTRPFDDRLYGIDHIFIKLKRVAESMNTKSAAIEAKRRFTYIEGFLEQLKTEIE